MRSDSRTSRPAFSDRVGGVPRRRQTCRDLERKRGRGNVERRASDFDDHQLRAGVGIDHADAIDGQHASRHAGSSSGFPRWAWAADGAAQLVNRVQRHFRVVGAPLGRHQFVARDLLIAQLDLLGEPLRRGDPRHDMVAARKERVERRRFERALRHLCSAPRCG